VDTGAAIEEERMRARGPLPDPLCTPGAVMTEDLELLCHQATRTRRHVRAATHEAVFTSYGDAYPPPPGAYEVDHLIPLALGGANVIANLWPEPSEPQPGFHEKDRVEDYLHREVCAGRMDLAEAQRAIATDWPRVHRQIQGTSPAPRGDDRDDEWGNPPSPGASARLPSTKSATLRTRKRPSTPPATGPRGARRRTRRPLRP
jgi:hypothetical protein